MEDDLLPRGPPVRSNVQLVRRTVEIIDRLGRLLATPDEAREMLGIE